MKQRHRTLRRGKPVTNDGIVQSPDMVAAIDSIARELIPAAIARLVARALEPETTPSPAENDRFLNPDEAAALLGVHRRWIYNNRNRLGAVKLSRRKLRIRESALRAFMNVDGAL